MNTQTAEVIVLGTAQDGGIPQIACQCSHCQAARTDASKRRLIASLGIVDHEAQEYWLVDATPDIGEQLHHLVSKYPVYRLAGILLTHAHIGHYLGLALLGREGLNIKELPVFGTHRMHEFLAANQPWKQLIDLGIIAPVTVSPGTSVRLGSGASAMPHLVPHRDELSDTVAFSIAGPTKRLVYCPDIDRWEGNILRVIAESDIALLDGTFYSTDELPGRDISEIPHPCIAESIQTFAVTKTAINFIHLNHTNRILSDEFLVAQLRNRGFRIGKRDDIWEL